MIEALRGIVVEVVRALTPLVQAASDSERMLRLLSDLGWAPNSVPQPLADLTTAGSDLIAFVGADPDATATPDVFAAVSKLVAAIDETRTMPDSAFPSGLDVASFQATIGADLLDYLLVEYLLSYHYGIGGPLLLAGFIRLVPQPASGLRQQYLRRQVMWSAAGEIFEDPVRGFRDAFDWNSGAPRLTAALGALGSLLEQAGMRFSYIRPADELLAFVTAGATDQAYDYLGIDVVFDTEALDTTGFAAGLRLLVLSATASGGQAVGLLPYATLTEAVGVEVADNLTLSVQGNADFTKGVALILAPGQPVDLQAGFLGGQPTSPATIAVKLIYTPPPEDPERVLIGTADGSRLSMQGLTVTSGATLISAGKIDAFAQIDLQDALVAIKPDPDETDSFIGSLLGDQGISAQLSFGLRLSSLTGFHLAGSDGLRANLPVGVHLGPVDIQAVELALDTSGGDVSLAVGAAIAGTIGPLSILADQLGFTVTARFPSPPTGNLGPLDLRVEFAAPSGVGVTLDSAGLTGGGFLSHDEAASQYAGMLQLSYQGFQLQAFGLIATKLPTGPGYSMVAMVDATFPPIQLVAGFTLNGVGGLLGINRTVSTDALAAAIKAKTLSNFLFAKNPVANAAQLLTDLATFFPAAQRRYVFGPLLQIGWGTPTAITIDLALILELPDPVRLVLIGELTVLLPNPNAALLEMHMDVLGTVDFGTDEGSLDAVLHDSRLVQYPLQGSMALRSCWSGSDKTFLLSVGGFHPKFQPPPGFPALQRVSISMPSGPLSKLNLDGYFAISSNTLQLGARIDLFYGADGFGIAGNLNFDTLIERNPFYFDGDISGGVTLSVDGDGVMSVDLSADLTGPAPWHCAGKVHFSVLGFGVTKQFSHTFGSSAPAQATELIDVGEQVRAALSDPRNFTATLTANQNGLVSLLTPTTQGVAVGHPAAGLKVLQRIVPLGLTIQKFGAGAPSGDTEFTITAVTVDGAGENTTPVQDEFAPAQFLNMSDDDKLTSPSFEPFDAGISLADGALTFGNANASGMSAITHPVSYETWLVDTPGGDAREDTGLPVPPERFSGIVWTLNNSGRLRYAAPSQPMVHAAKLDYVVATTDQIAASGVGVAAGQMYAQAHAALREAITSDPTQSGALQVVPLYEVAHG